MISFVLGAVVALVAKSILERATNRYRAIHPRTMKELNRANRAKNAGNRKRLEENLRQAFGKVN